MLKICTLSPEGISLFLQNLHRYIIGRCKRADEVLVTLTLFSRPQEIKEW